MPQAQTGLIPEDEPWGSVRLEPNHQAGIAHILRKPSHANLLADPEIKSTCQWVDGTSTSQPFPQATFLCAKIMPNKLKGSITNTTLILEGRNCERNQERATESRFQLPCLLYPKQLNSQLPYYLFPTHALTQSEKDRRRRRKKKNLILPTLQQDKRSGPDPTGSSTKMYRKRANMQSLLQHGAQRHFISLVFL